ncbi:heme ABC transporter ATP-binding protein [Actinophytocola xinjiangensis]|uniref:Heme ABC transporter ATP-binding protein n=1 Tax=Actinophytocola xinjiangensis TaxID=485602 RepID=A0A7Z0WQL3_9PSEU|nr:ABC transporter ATP-binding protein [Actinophytocola xinjiangensis]OLF13111.1 heme ABC transporter ATP-binding protein [Actinophytocola xinjiangensis]
MTQPAVQLTGIVKRFGELLANDHVDLTVARGEIHALMGENGAGKSTLMSILYGLLRPDAGTIALDGEPVVFDSAARAIAAGIGMVQQGFALFDSMPVVDNVIYGAEPTRRGLLDRRAATAAVSELVERHGLRLAPTDRVGDLPIGVRQQVEILKLLYRRARVLILDEPTAVLTPAETEQLFTVLRDLAADGHTVLLVTHKLHEVTAVSDTVTVLRDGKVTMTGPTSATGRAELASAMTGREVDLDRVYPAGQPGAEALTVTGLTVDGRAAGRPAVDDVSLSVRAGEIVGIAGVAGNGQTELVAAIAGLLPARGSVTVGERELSGLGVARRRAAGLAHIPEDRAEVGAAPGARLTDNLATGFHRRPPLLRKGFLRSGAMRTHAERIIERFGVRAPGPSAPMRTLSGGNQQKAILGRELTHEAPVLLVEQPTRGVDIGAVVGIHTELIAYRDAGHAVLLVSAELSEVLGLADRVLVMYEGRVVAEFPKTEADPHAIGLAMAGGAPRGVAGGTAEDSAGGAAGGVAGAAGGDEADVVGDATGHASENMAGDTAGDTTGDAAEDSGGGAA